MIHHTGRNPTAGKTADSRLHFSQTNSRYFGMKPELTASSNPTWNEGKRTKQERKRQAEKKSEYNV
jgi:hypothetical protein